MNKIEEFRKSLKEKMQIRQGGKGVQSNDRPETRNQITFKIGQEILLWLQE